MPSAAKASTATLCATRLPIGSGMSAFSITVLSCSSDTSLNGVRVSSTSVTATYSAPSV